MVLHGVEIKTWNGEPSNYVVVAIDGVATWAENYSAANTVARDEEFRTGETVYIYRASFATPNL